MKKIFKSAFIVLAVAAVAGYGTYSYFSDTETSTGNNFTAGAIDLTITHDQEANPACTISQTPGGPIFDCADVKPGDIGESTLHFNLTSNPAWACVKVKNFVDSDNGCNEPELAAETGCATDGNGELDNELLLTVWIDNGGESASCNNVLDQGEEIVAQNAALSSFALPSGDVVLPVADSSGESMMNDPLQPGEHCLGIKWSVDPTAGNDVQTDKLGGDLEFYVEQERNNPNFRCIPLPVDSDNDRDPDATDCDINDPAVNHSAIEIFDAIDNDCDGLVNEGIVSWVSPTGFVDATSMWDGEELLYDHALWGIYATVPQGQYLELTLPVATNSNNVRFWAPPGTANNLVTSVDVDVYYSGDWHNVYSAGLATNAYTEAAFANQSVTKARVRYNGHAGFLGEFEFYANN